MNIVKPALEQLSSYYQSYLKYVPEVNLLEALKHQKESTDIFLKSIPESKASFRYATGKWELKEVIGHLCDTERILTYRALRFSRNDKTSLSGFEENYFVDNSNYKSRTLSNIAEELKSIGLSTIALFNNMNEEMYDLKGIANKTEVSVSALLFFILAHERHHLNVIQERYLL